MKIERRLCLGVLPKAVRCRRRGRVLVDKRAMEAELQWYFRLGLYDVGMCAFRWCSEVQVQVGCVRLSTCRR